MVVSNLMGIFLIKINSKYSDKPYSNLKPGQITLERDYYAKATTEKPDG